MKTFWKEFFKKLWAILVRIFWCCAPYFYYIRTGKKTEKQETVQELSDEKTSTLEKSEESE